MKKVSLLGRQAAGVDIKILRDDGSEALANEIGIIAIHSPFITPGYLSNDSLNQEVFHEHLSKPGWRIYRTKDLGKLNKNNELTFMGRSGSMVKVNGFSVDIIEVETIIKLILNLNDIAVIARVEGEQTFLVAFMGKVHLQKQEIRALFMENLSSYMVPREIIILDRLPLTDSLKIDRNKLSKFEINNEHQDNSPDFNQAKSFFFVLVHATFEKILNKNIDDYAADFFHLGGNSLALSELQLQLEKAFNIKSVPSRITGS